MCASSTPRLRQSVVALGDAGGLVLQALTFGKREVASRSAAWAVW
jgi:hypothetical protein